MPRKILGTKNALLAYVMEGNVNLQTQATNQAYVNTIGDADGVSTENQTGKLNGEKVVIEVIVDASTKDDEVASYIIAVKTTKKELEEKTNKEQQKAKLNKVDATKDAENVNEQQQQGKRISKQVEVRLKIINKNTNEDLQNTINQRSYSLFSGSEDKYRECCNKFNALLEKGASSPEEFEELLNTFDDVAEQHNALQITKDVWERKLTGLKTLAKETRERAVGEDSTQSQEQENDYKQLQQQIKKLESNIENLNSIQDKLMLENGNRIEDSYKLAPLLREVTANLVHDIALPPKSFNEIILDKVLPLNGDPVKTFECLCENFIENNKTAKNIGESISCFENNLFIIRECLKHELKTCQDTKVSFAIVNVCRASEKLEAVNNENIMVVNLTANSFAKNNE